MPASGSDTPYWDGYSGPLLTTSAATGDTATVLPSPGWATNTHVGKLVFVASGPGKDEVARVVIANTADTLQVAPAWSTPPAASQIHLSIGQWVQYHYRAHDLVPSARGDNWFDIFHKAGGVTPCTMLMQRLAQLHPGGFRLFKYYTPGGFAAARPGQGGWTLMTLQLTQALAAMAAAGDTPQFRAIILDHATSDIAAANVNYLTHVNETIAGVRGLHASAADAVVVVVNPHPETMRTSIPGAAQSAREANRIVSLHDDTKLCDMNWGKFASSGVGSSSEQTDPRWFDPETYLQAGVYLFNAIQRFYTELPDVEHTQPIVGLFVIGDSQVACSTVLPSQVQASRVASLLGPDPTELTNLMTDVLIYDDEEEDVVGFDIVSNASNFGFPVGPNWFGPEATAARELKRAYPERKVLIFKYGQPGLALTSDTGLPHVEKGSVAWGMIEKAWLRTKLRCLEKFGASIEMVGGIVSLAENNIATAAVAASWQAAIDTWVQDVIDLFTTGVERKPTLVFMQPPPPAATTAGGSVYQTAELREQARTFVADMPSRVAGVRVLPSSPDRYELSRVDNIHYSGEAVLRIGEDAAVLILEARSALVIEDTGAVDSAEQQESAEVTMSPLEAALDAPDVASFTSPGGESVQRRSVDELLALEQAARERRARQRGIRNVQMRFRR